MDVDFLISGRGLVGCGDGEGAYVVEAVWAGGVDVEDGDVVFGEAGRGV